MPCYHPIPARISPRPGRPGKKDIELHPKGEPTHWLPCGKCLGCREVQQQQLAIRVAHEARFYEEKSFLTLTVDDAHIGDGGLSKRDVSLFWKRIRARTCAKIKHLTAGEYGDRTQRAHYHAAVLGLVIGDQKKWDSENNTSEMLTETWGKGIVTVSELTEDRIRYVAGYVLKKAGYRKQIYCTQDGVDLEPPFRLMSKGLGEQWIKKYKSDLQKGYMPHDGARNTIPRYYLDKIKKEDEGLYNRIKCRQADEWKELTAEDRRLLHNAEKIRLAQIKQQRQPRDRI